MRRWKMILHCFVNHYIMNKERDTRVQNNGNIYSSSPGWFPYRADRIQEQTTKKQEQQQRREENLRKRAEARHAGKKVFVDMIFWYWCVSRNKSNRKIDQDSKVRKKDFWTVRKAKKRKTKLSCYLYMNIPALQMIDVIIAFELINSIQVLSLLAVCLFGSNPNPRVHACSGCCLMLRQRDKAQVPCRQTNA